MKKLYSTLILVFVITIAYSQTFEFSLTYGDDINQSVEGFRLISAIEEVEILDR